MHNQEPLIHGHFYHIYNCGINGETLFRGSSNYERFLHLYDQYIESVAETYAWCLMGNHLHLLVRIKSEEEVGYYKYSSKLNADRSDDAVRFYKEHKWEITTDLSAPIAIGEEPDRVIPLKKPAPTKHFSHLFNAYAKYYNKRYKRHGALFERPFRRKRIDNRAYFKNVLLYIHHNPVHHGFCEHQMDYPWSSYLTCVSVKSTKLQRDKVIGWFDNVGNFKTRHNDKVDVVGMEKWLGL